MVYFQILRLFFLLFIELESPLVDHFLYILFGCIFRESSENDCIVTGRVDNIITFFLDLSEIVSDVLKEYNVYNDKSEKNVVLNR
jgi:hypothetical protein